MNPLFEKDLYKRQYVLSNFAVDIFATANTYKINENYVVTAESSLEVTQLSKDSVGLTLLGFLLDPQNPEFNNYEILQELLSHITTFEELLLASYRYGGKWVLIYSGKDGIKLVNDLVGARQVYYTNHYGFLCCASQPHVLAKLCNKTRSTDPELNDFWGSESFAYSESAWIGDESRYNDVKHLLPNKYLDFTTHNVVRFWPNITIESKALNEVVPKVSSILQGIMKAANNRFDLSLAVSAGWDSRVLLAAARPIIKDCYCFIQKFNGMKGSHCDIVVPQELAKKLRFDFDVREATDYNSEFDKVLKTNVDIVQSENKKVLYYDFYKNFSNKVNVSGVVGELSRSRFGKNRPVSAKALAKIFGRDDSPYAIRMAEQWLKEVKENKIVETGVSLWDLFYWEHYIGNWGTSFQAGLDIAVDELYPFNCRDIIEQSYSLKDLSYENSPLFIGLINEMWPEALSEPVNPTTRIEKLIKLAKKLLRKIGFFNQVKVVYYRLCKS